MPALPSAERREQIVAAALEVATKEGLAATTTRRVAAEAGVAPGVIHYAFGSMDSLYRAMINAIVVEVLDRAMTILHPGDDLKTYLERAVAVTFENVEREPERHLLTFELTVTAARDHTLADLGRWQYQSYFTAVERFLTEVAERTATTWSVPVAVLARMYMNILEGVTLTWLIDRDSEAARAVTRLFVDQLAGLSQPSS